MMDKQRGNIQQPNVVSQQQSRPVSWHPNTYSNLNFTQNTSYFLDSNDAYHQPTFYSTATVNGLYTPLSQPVVDEPQIHELITPLEGLTADEIGHHYDEDAFDYQYWMPHDISKQQQQFSMDSTYQAVQQPTWHWNFTFNQDLPTAPSSPTFLPIQGGMDASPLDLNTRNLPAKSDGEELVAMGLYDSPAEVQSSSLLFGGGRTRKRSLKLEESFEPQPESEQDETEDADGEDDESADADAQDTTSLTHFTDEQAPQLNPSMAGQSFFFDTEHAVSSHQQAVYPSAMSGFSGGLLNQATGWGWI